MGAVLSCVAVVIFAVFAVLRIVGAPVEVPPWREIAILLPVLVGSYFLLGALGATALWLLYPLCGSLIGWMLRGVILTPVVYCTVTLSDVLVYTYTGVTMIGFESTAEAWGFLRLSVPLFALVGGLLGGPILYFKVGRQAGLTSDASAPKE